MAKYAVIDIGTNSIKFHVAEKDDQGNWSVVTDRAEIARLGEGLQQTGEISQEAMKRNAQAIKKMVEEAKQMGVETIAAVGTMALRSAKNAAAFVEKVNQECGIAIEILPGEEEARLSYIAVKSGVGLAEGQLVIFDTGGGSTEFIFGKGDEIEKKFSLNVGAVRFTEEYLKSDPVKEQEYQQAVAAIEDALNQLSFDEKVDALVGMGGTMSNLGAIKHKLSVYDPDIIQGSKLSLQDVEEQIELFKSKTIEERKQIVGLQPKRADVILAGAIIVRTILKKAGVDFATISDRGLRHGLIVDRFGK
ncbi:phosphatase [candidate division KSB1 bacterium 4484_87]|nr:MAG: phosphatase [candidate division KSB1 bacterium 4484_87]